jgi:hypothetical protein
MTISSAPLPAPGSCLPRQLGRCPRGDVSALAPGAPHRVTSGVPAVRSVRGRSGHGRTGPGDARVLSPPPAGYVIYGITRSARGTRRQPAASHGYACPPGRRSRRPRHTRSTCSVSASRWTPSVPISAIPAVRVRRLVATCNCCQFRGFCGCPPGSGGPPGGIAADDGGYRAAPAT